MEALFLQDTLPGPATLQYALLSLLLAFICGQSLAWVYMLTHSGYSYSKTYVNSLVVIPFLVATVMMVLSNNLVTAFSLMALFAIVRFRNILRDTLDTCYILGCITLGMACGTGRHSTALLALVLLAAMLLYLSYSSFGARKRYDLILNVHWTRPLAELTDLRTLLSRHSRKSLIASQRNTDDGSDLSYHLTLRDPNRVDELLREVKSLHGAVRVTSMSAPEESEL